MLRLSNVSVSYGPIKAVKNLSLEVKQGEIVALVGCNGAGKTTVLRAISGLLQAEAGSVIEFDGKSVANVKAHKLVRLGMSHVPERRGIFANLTVLENLKMGAYSRKLKESEMDEVFSLFPRLGERKKQIAGTLSGGEQQMLAIGRGLLSRPRLMLLDEPSLGLAPQITKSIFQTIKRINENGTTVLLVEQNAQAALRASHRAYVIEVGEIAISDTSENLLKNDSVRKAYLGEA